MDAPLLELSWPPGAARGEPAGRP